MRRPLAFALALGCIGLGAACGPTTSTTSPIATNATTGTPVNTQTPKPGATPSASAKPALPNFGANLVVNGDAEQGTGSTDGSTIAMIPNWRPTGGFTMNSWSISDPAFPQRSDPGPADRGANYFAGGPNNAMSTADIVYDNLCLTNPPYIAKGTEPYELTGWLGGVAGQDDNMEVVIVFLNQDAKIIGGDRIGPVFDADRHGVTGMVYKSSTGKLPASTDRVNVIMTSTRVSGTYNDGYADDVSFRVSC